MEKLIMDMMSRAGITESELEQKKVVHSDQGEDLSWEYLQYVRNKGVSWSASAAILSGSRDELQTMENIKKFANQTGSDLTVMEGGEHWFHPEQQMAFLDAWLIV